MRTLMLVTLGLTLSFPLLSHAESDDPVQDERALYEDCSAFSQAGMRECLARKADESQKVLMQVEGQAISALSQWNEDAKYIRLAKAKLAAANKAFAGYRKAQCAYSAVLSGGGAGNGSEMGRLACVAELNSRRAAQLRAGFADLPIR